MEYVTVSDTEVPAIGVGTWQMETGTAYNAVSNALDSGYRHVDTAQIYENESGVGRAIAEADVDREDVFLTTKVNPTHRSVESIVTSVEDSLEELGTDYVDLLLIHWPHPLADLEDVMTGLNEAVDRSMTRNIGVSNFGKDRLDRARELSDAPILTDQVLFHPWWPQRELLSYCQDNDVMLTAYSPLANGALIGDELLANLGDRYGKTGPQVAIRWATQHENVATIPMSTSRNHLAENIDVFDFKLTREEHDRVTRPSYARTGIALARGMIGV
nr:MULTISPECIES: aldo/keto reductase [unclassified Halorhabdus]